MYKNKLHSTKEIFVLIFIALGLMFFFHLSGLDEMLSSLFFDPQLRWIYRDHFILENILHKGGVWLTITIFLWIIFQCISSYKVKNKEKCVYYLLVLIASITSVLLVALLKKYTTFPCPWDVTIFGGGRTLISFTELFSSELPNGHCFPAGHSSGGFCFLSFYFVSLALSGKRDVRKLSVGLGLGLLFGLTQQMRGAHFASHDMATLALTIFIPWLTTWVYCRYN